MRDNYLPAGNYVVPFGAINVLHRPGLPVRVVVHFNDYVFIKNLDRPAASNTFHHLATVLGLDPDEVIVDGIPIPERWRSARGRHVEVNAEQRVGASGHPYLAVRWVAPDDEGPCSFRPEAAGGVR